MTQPGRDFEPAHGRGVRPAVRDLRAHRVPPRGPRPLQRSLRGRVAPEVPRRRPEDLNDGGFQDWLDLVRSATAEGRRFSRVRVVSLPLTDYSRYGIAYARFTNAAGDDIRYLTRDRARAIGLPDHDYWLFDSRKIARLHFDEGDDHLLGVEMIEDPAEVVQHNYWRDAARHWAVRRDDFAAEYDK